MHTSDHSRLSRRPLLSGISILISDSPSRRPQPEYVTKKRKAAMRKAIQVWLWLACCAVAFAQTTPNIGLALPPINSSNWGTKLNNNMTILDGLLSGNANVPGLHLSGNFQVPSSPGFSTIGGGLIGYDATANVYVAGNNSVAIRFPYVIGSAPSGCAQWGANYALTGTGVACGAGSGGISGPGSSTNLFIPQWNGTSGNALLAGLGVTTVIGTPGVDTNVPTERAVRNAISAAGGGNVSTAGALTIGNVMIGAGGTNIQDSGKALPSGPLADTNSAQTFTSKSIGASQIDSGTTAGPRSVSLTGLTTGTRYYGIVLCAVEQPTFQFLTH